MSILLTSPAYLLAIPALVGRRSRLVAGSLLAVVAIAFVEPPALQPGLGPVRLPVQQRLRGIRAAARGGRA